MTIPRRQIRTMCPMNCHPTQCGMLVEVEQERVTSIKGDPENPDSRGFLCMRGQATQRNSTQPLASEYPITSRRHAWRRSLGTDLLGRCIFHTR